MSSGGAGRPNRPEPTPSELPTRTELNTPSTPGVCGLGSGQHPAGGSESQPHALHLIRQPSSCPRLEWTPVGAAGGASLSLAVMEAEQLGQRARAGEALGSVPCTAEPGRAASRQPRGHLPATLACTDCTRWRAALWASGPFYSARYETGGFKPHRTLGRGRLTSLPRLNSLNQEPGFSLGQEVILA